MLYCRSLLVIYFKYSRGGAMVTNLPTNGGAKGSIPGLGRSPGGGNGNPLQYPCLEKSHGQRSLVGYSLWGCKESDTAEWLSMQDCIQRTFYHLTISSWACCSLYPLQHTLALPPAPYFLTQPLRYDFSSFWVVGFWRAKALPPLSLHLPVPSTMLCR